MLLGQLVLRPLVAVHDELVQETPGLAQRVALALGLFNLAREVAGCLIVDVGRFMFVIEVG